MENKYQEALNFIFGYALDGSLNDNESNMVREKVSILQELVDKETPMKVNKQANKEKVYLNDVSYVYEDVVLGECPNCKTYSHEENEYGDTIDYCHYCGQKLDWSE